MVQTWRIGLIGGSIAGREVRIEGLERTMTDALVRIEFADGTTWTEKLTPDRPGLQVPGRADRLGGGSNLLAARY